MRATLVFSSGSDVRPESEKLQQAQTEKRDVIRCATARKTFFSAGPPPDVLRNSTKVAKRIRHTYVFGIALLYISMRIQMGFPSKSVCSR